MSNAFLMTVSRRLLDEACTVYLDEALSACTVYLESLTLLAPSNHCKSSTPLSGWMDLAKIRSVPLQDVRKRFSCSPGVQSTLLPNILSIITQVISLYRVI